MGGGGGWQYLGEGRMNRWLIDLSGWKSIEFAIIEIKQAPWRSESKS